jgi:hypothetical protein
LMMERLGPTLLDPRALFLVDGDDAQWLDH